MTKYKKNLLAILSFLLIITVLTPTITKPFNPKENLRKLERQYPYLFLNIGLFIQTLKQLSFFADLESQSLFKDASQEEIDEIKNIAKDLKFSDQDIKKLSVKKARKYNDFDFEFLNNYASFFNTIIIGRQNIDIFKKLDQDPNAKKFTYAHELCHTKYNHMLKTIFAIFISPIIVHFSVAAFNSILRDFLNDLREDNLYDMFFYGKTKERMEYNNSIKLLMQYIPAILNSCMTKMFLQTILILAIKKRFEKDADLGAASLGADSIDGGIKFFEAIKKLRQDKHNAIVGRFDNKIVKLFVSGLLKLKSFFNGLIDSHPSDDARIKYLQAELLKIEQKKASQESQNQNIAHKVSICAAAQ